MPYTKDQLNSMYQAADYSAKQATGESISDSAEDYLVKGTFSAAASAGVGLANSAIGIGRAIGVTDSDYLNEAEVIGSLAGNETADFYRRHKTGIDMAGMVGSMVLTSGVAIAGLRAAQLAGTLGGAYELATGMSNADIVLGSSAVRSAILTSTEGVETFSKISTAMMGVYAQGFKQALLENAVGLVAGNLANNQNIALNPDHDKGAFESTWELTKDNALSTWFIGGTAVQGAVEGIKGLGYVSKAVKAADLEAVEKFYGPVLGELGSFLGMEPGDALMRANKAKNYIKTSEEFIAATADPVMAGRARRASDIVDMAINEQVARAVDTIESPEARGAAVDELLKIVNSPLEDNGADRLALLSTVGVMTKSSQKEMASLYQKTAAPMLMYDLIGGNKHEVRLDLYERLREHLISGNPHADPSDLATIAHNTANDYTKNGTNLGAGLAPVSSYRQAEDLLFGTMELNSTGGLLRNTLVYASPEHVESSGVLERLNGIRSSVGLETLTAKEYSNIIAMHELGHVKGNTQEFLDSFSKMANRNPELFKEVYTLSNLARNNELMLAGKKMGYDWSTAEKFAASVKEQPELLVKGRLSNQFSGKVTTAVELIADSASAMFSDKYREVAAKLAPNMAKVFQTSGAAALPWSDTRMFLNTRTGERLSSTLPGASDIGKVSFTKDGSILLTPYKQAQKGIQSSDVYSYDVNIFMPLSVQGGKDIGDMSMLRKDYLQASAMYAAKSQTAIWKDAVTLAEKDKSLNAVLTVDYRDLPSWEFGIKQGHELLDEGSMLDAKIRIVGIDGNVSSPLSLADAEMELLSAKKVLRTTYATNKMNEEEIAHLLNIDKSLAIGNDKGEWMLSKTKDYTKPEIFEMQYKGIDVPDQIIRARSQTYHEINTQAVGLMQQTVAASLLGNDMARFIDPTSLRGLEAPTQVSSRTGLVSSAQNTFNTARAAFAAIGKATADTIRSWNDETLKAYQGLTAHFSAAENVEARALLATADNFTRRNKSILASFEDGSHALISTSALGDLAEELKNSGRWEGTAKELREMISQEHLPDDFRELLDSRTSMLLDRRLRVGEFYELHRDNNSRIIGWKQQIARARGGAANLEHDIIYSAPMDLKSTPHVAFVIPNEVYAQADPSRYMVYGSTAVELEEKVNSIYAGAGNKYKVVYGNKGGDIELYKKMVGDYDKGQIFDEQFFDAAKFKKGSSAQLKPNLDLNVASTFNRYVNWTLRQNEYAVRSAVELRYADTFAEMRWMDRAAKRTEQGLFGAKKAESIYRDSMNMMLDIRSQGNEAQQLWKKVNDFVGEKGSELIHNALTGAKQSGKALSLDDFDKINKTLADAGVESPYNTINEMISASPDIIQKRQLNGLVRSMNTVTATLGLRLDVANSIVNIVSAPILQVPILRTALRDLPQGNAAREALLDMTSVRVPGTNLREPSVMKLLMVGTKNFFGPEGKAKVAEYAAKGLVPNFLDEYLNVMDDLALSGNHTAAEAATKLNKFVEFGAKWSGHTKTEAFTRFLAANAVEQIGVARGLSADEIFIAQVNAIDQIHGIHRYSAKPQLFNGVVGQAIGLYQTYTFNMLHNMARFVADRDKANAAIMTGLQASIFGLQGLPGFSEFNNSIMRSNGKYFDAYNATGADTGDKGLGSYLLYGAASHIFSTPVDLAGRGGITPRNPLLVPTDMADIPAVSIFAKGVANIVHTVELANNGNVSAADAVLHGLAHNGFSRPIQGLANIARGFTDTQQGQPLFTSINHINYDELEELNFAAITARLIGTRPLKETMLLDTKYRQDAFQGELRKRSENLGSAIKLSLASGDDISRDMVRDYTKQYAATGLPLEGFNSFWSRQLSAVSQKDMNTFRQSLAKDEETKRLIQNMKSYRSQSKPWDETGRFPKDAQNGQQ